MGKNETLAQQVGSLNQRNIKECFTEPENESSSIIIKLSNHRNGKMKKEIAAKELKLHIYIKLCSNTNNQPSSVQHLRIKKATQLRTGGTSSPHIQHEKN